MHAKGQLTLQELEFLDSVGLITPAQMNSILPPLKAIVDTHATEAERAAPASRQLAQEPVNPVPAQSQPPAPYAPSYTPPASQMSHMSMNEKAAPRSQYTSPVPQAPPAYAQTPPVRMATAQYTYSPADEGDLGFEPQHRIQITQELNKDCMVDLVNRMEPRLISDKQGGEAATQIPDRKVSSLRALSLRIRPRLRQCMCPLQRTMATCPSLSARVDSPPRTRQTPKTPSRTSWRKAARSSERNLEMPVCFMCLPCALMVSNWP